MLYANRNVVAEAVEYGTVERTRDGLEISGSSQPPARVRFAGQRACERRGIFDFRRAASNRCQCCGERVQVDMVIVQSRQQRSAVGFENFFVSSRRQADRNFADEAVSAKNVDDFPGHFRFLN